MEHKWRYQGVGGDGRAFSKIYIYEVVSSISGHFSSSSHDAYHVICGNVSFRK